MRSTKEWRGRTDDSKPPDYVRLRIFNAYDGVCYLSKRKIVAGDKWDLEHIEAICNGGLNVESNMAPALVAPHKIKTKQDRATKAKNDHVRMKHFGIRAPSRLRSRGFPACKPQLTASKPLQKDKVKLTPAMRRILSWLSDEWRQEDSDFRAGPVFLRMMEDMNPPLCEMKLAPPEGRRCDVSTGPGVSVHDQWWTRRTPAGRAHLSSERDD